MQPRLHPRVTPGALELVRRFEGFRSRALPLPQGGWVIGHGHVGADDPGREITREEAGALLLHDLSRLAERIEPLILAPVTPAQFDALLSFAFAVGPQAFARSAVLKRLNAGAPLDAAAVLEFWRCAEIDGEEQVVDALVRRRAAEKARFLEPPADVAPIPSALLRAAPDPTALALAARLSGEGRAASVRPDARRGLAVEGREPEPTAALAVVAALSARIDRLLAAEEPPAPPVTASPPPPPPPPAPTPPSPALRPVAAPPPVAPAPANDGASASPAVAGRPPADPVRQPAASAPVPPAATETEAEGRSERVSPPALRVPALVLGLAGLVLFLAALWKTYQAPSLPWLGLGLLAVAAMTPASLVLLGGRRRDEDR